MLSLLKKWFVPKPGYDAQKRKLEGGSAQDLLALAQSEWTNPEILYLLATSNSGEVRRAVAVNKATPLQASAVMAKDADTDVRLKLADRLVKLLPGLTPDEHGKLYAYAVQALITLTQDEAVQVWRELALALQDYAKAPPEVVNRLARDIERTVAEPILRFCLALADSELIDIISNHPESWVLSSIAARAEVGTQVSAAIIHANDEPAIGTLLVNPRARIGLDQLNDIIDRAGEHPGWHRPIALRPEISVDLAHRLAGFVDSAILELLEKRSDFDAETRQGIADLVKRRMEFARADTPSEAAAARVERLARENRLTPEVIHDALNWQDHEFVVLALSFLSGVHAKTVRMIAETRKPKPVIALCRKANLPMRLAVDMQRILAKVPRGEIMYAKDGTDYPLTDDEIRWQLEFFGAPGNIS